MTIEVEQRIVTMENGEQVNFGQRANIISTQEISADGTGFTLTFNVFNGTVLTYTYVSEVVLPKLLLEMAAFGASSKAKASTAGAESLDAIVDIIKGKIAEFSEGLFVTRGGGAASNLVLTLQQEAYADMEGLDKNDPETIAKIKDFFAEMSKEAKSALVKDTKFKYHMRKLQFEAMEAELGIHEAA